MTNEELAEVDELVGRLRQPNECERWLFSVPFEAADMLQSLIATTREAEALRAENERLREALRELVEEYVHNVDSTRLGGFYLDPETEDCVIDARAALKENPNAG